MIENITISKFKSLDNVQDIALGRVNVFIGPNGAGKSNFLEAVGLLGAAAEGRVDDAALLRRGVRPSVPAIYKSSFRGQQAPNAIFLKAENRDVSYSAGLWAPLREATRQWAYHSESFKIGDKKLVGRSQNTKKTERLNPNAGEAALRMVDLEVDSPEVEFLTALQRYRIFTPATQFLRGLAQDPQQEAPVGLSGGRFPEAVHELIRGKGLTTDQREELWEDVAEVFGWSDRVAAMPVIGAPLSKTVPAPRTILMFRDRYMADKRNTLTAYDASEGALFVLFALVVALHPESPSISAIDNLDHGLNPRAARRLMELICKWTALIRPERQLLITCHNPLALDGLPLRDDPGVRLFAVDRAVSGKSIVKPIVVDKNLLSKAKEGWPLSRLWVMGLLGGVPDV